MGRIWARTPRSSIRAKASDGSGAASLLVIGPSGGLGRESYTITLAGQNGSHVSIHCGRRAIFDSEADQDADVPTARIVVAALACLRDPRADRFLLKWLRESAFSRWVSPWTE